MSQIRSAEESFPKSQEGPLVLLAGSRAETRRMMRLVLESWGLDAAETGSCWEAPEAAAKCRPVLVLIDATEPFSESLAAAAALKGQLSTVDIPILMISGFTRPSFRQAAVAVGVSDYLTKPCDLQKLHKSVFGLTNLRPTGHRLPRESNRNHRPRIRSNSVI